jgi:hypothetical protein
MDQAPRCRVRLLPVNVDVFSRAAVGDGNHDPQTDRDDDAHDRPKGADRRKNPGLPESRENATHKDHITYKVQSSRFHEGISLIVFTLLVRLAPTCVLAVISIDVTLYLLHDHDTRSRARLGNSNAILLMTIVAGVPPFHSGGTHA